MEMSETLPAKTAPQPPAKTEPKKPLTLREELESDNFKQQIARALPKHMTADRMIRVAATAMSKTPLLMKCNRVSFLGAMLTLSQFGLEPNGRDAHLIPFNNTKAGTVDCQLIIDYKGYVKLILQSGLVSHLHADVVCENDDFEYDQGVIVKHKIDLRKPRGAMYAAYATATFKDGTKKSEVMSKEEIEAIRKRSKAGNYGPWQTDYSEMSKKSVFRRLQKWLPLSSDIVELSEHDDDRIDVTIGEPEPSGQRKSVASKVIDDLTKPEEPQEEPAGLIEQQEEEQQSEENKPEIDPFSDLAPGPIAESVIVEYVASKRPEHLNEKSAKELVSKALKTNLDKPWAKTPRDSQIEIMKKWAAEFAWPSHVIDR